MNRCPRWSVARILFACWLILLAGGDDLNMARLALPTLLDCEPGDTLPLDDPNFDFSQAPESRLPRGFDLGIELRERGAPRVIRAALAATPSRTCRRPTIPTPLRC